MLVVFSNRAYLGVVIGQAVVCSTLFHILFTRASAACGLRNCPPSAYVDGARTSACSSPFLQRNHRLLQKRCGHSTRRLASRDPILAEPGSIRGRVAVSCAHGPHVLRVLSFVGAHVSRPDCSLSAPR